MDVDIAFCVLVLICVLLNGSVSAYSNSLQSAGGGVFGKGHDPIGIVCALSNLTHFNCCYNKVSNIRMHSLRLLPLFC